MTLSRSGGLWCATRLVRGFGSGFDYDSNRSAVHQGRRRNGCERVLCSTRILRKRLRPQTMGKHEETMERTQ
jgi:hypothetical protein